MHCAPCHAPRTGFFCWKCGEKLYQPVDGWKDTRLPPIDRIREIARGFGYAIAVHGSQERDLDLVAAPWTEEAADACVLVCAIAKAFDGTFANCENKPHGRLAFAIMPGAYIKVIDLSVMPKTTPR